MKKRCFLGFCWIVMSTSVYAFQASVFVSFSLPKNLLHETLREAARLHIPVFINGLYHDSMPETAKKVMALSEQIPELSLQIDPTAFERFAIDKVPALVVEKGNNFDVIYGHLTIREGLLRIASQGSVGLSAMDARRLSGE